MFSCTKHFMPGIVPHRHCIVCGKAIEPDKTYCSKECEIEAEKERKRQRNLMLIMFGSMFLMLMLIIFMGR